ncbi:hypothetical protein [Arthrobacter burdickii]|uniref:Uncharacterized protein n=1 Tax=Arthrobacter burdickii TaxID=3035920 RepID=A0ABT8JWN9_9MICC|nr:hypothetical protein [Arthrobacter burdickii]MDN4609594.1 hypothetical protein [Arthrobacter burdickii]
MTAPAGSNQAPTLQRSHRISNTTILILGVVVIPFVLLAAFNSYGPLTVDSALRMAASIVVGQTIAILSVVTATVLAIKRRYGVMTVLATVVIAAMVTSSAVSTMTRAGDELLTRIDLVTETDASNR